MSSIHGTVCHLLCVTVQLIVKRIQAENENSSAQDSVSDKHHLAPLCKFGAIYMS